MNIHDQGDNGKKIVGYRKEMLKKNQIVNFVLKIA